MTSYLFRHILPAAYDVLPPAMASERASAMLIAIALQESSCAHRRQVTGPARSFWQFEVAGVTGVLTHPATGGHAKAALVALCYRPTMTPKAIHAALEHNDVLACVFARLLLWTLPMPLAGAGAYQHSWRQYLEAWRPGTPRPKDWEGAYNRAWRLVVGLP